MRESIGMETPTTQGREEVKLEVRLRCHQCLDKTGKHERESETEAEKEDQRGRRRWKFNVSEIK